MNLKLFLASFFLFISIIQVENSFASTGRVTSTVFRLENDSLKEKQDFKKVTKFIGGLFKKKKAVKKAIIKKAIAVRKDTIHNSVYINDFKKYKKIADSLSIDMMKEWDSVHHITDVDYHSLSDTVNKVVYGFHPYWMGSSHESYDYDLLTDIAYFSFELDPKTGLFETTNKWDENGILDSAQKYGCKMHITISNFTQSNNRKFLKNEKSRSDNIEEIIKAVTVPERGLDGVVIDFENVPSDVRDELTQYVKDLSTALKEHGKVLSITIPAIDSYNAFDIEGIEDYIQFFLLMGYDYYGSWSTEAGPVAPFYSQPLWGSYNVESSVDDYLTRGMEASQMILVVPYYGASWEVDHSELPSPRKKFLKSVTFREVKRSYSNETPILEPTSKSAYFNIETEEGVTQIWFDNVEALAHKYDFVISEKLAGIGIWALGYDNGYTDLWQLIEQKFGNVEIAADSTEKSTDIDLSSIFEMDLSPEGLYESFEKGGLVKVILVLMTLMLLLGFLLSLRRKEMRVIVFRKSLVTLIFLLIPPTGCLYIIFSTNYIQIGFFLLIGLLIGYGIYYIKEQTQFNSKKRIP